MVIEKQHFAERVLCTSPREKIVLERAETEASALVFLEEIHDQWIEYRALGNRNFLMQIYLERSKKTE